MALAAWLAAGGDIDVPGYRTLDKCPEVLAGVNRIAGIVGSMTIHLIENGKDGDKRILNALSRRVDIEPNAWQTRTTWMQGIVRDMLLYGNAVVIPQTEDGLIGDMIKLRSGSYQLQAELGGGYHVDVNGMALDPRELLHFVFSPNLDEPWRGDGLRTALQPVVDNLRQAAATTKAFMSSKFKPSLIISVDSTAKEFDSEAERNRLRDKLISDSEAGKPWLIPMDTYKVEQVKPLTLQDLAISETIRLDKKAVAAILGVPAFVLGVEAYSRDEWNNFIQSVIAPLALSIQQELTRKLIQSEKWYFRFNVASLYSYDLQALGNLLGSLYDRGIVNGDEVRERLNIGLNPAGLKQFKVLENYIPVEKSGDQKKLNP